MPSLVPPELHPMAIHFPIVLLLLAALLCLFARRLPWAGQALPWLLMLGTAGAVSRRMT